MGEERRAGHERDSFPHGIDEDDDGCGTRREVLLAEAVTKPERGDRCAITGGSWDSFYDEVEVTDARKLDIDHMVPPAEAWDSGASEWSYEVAPWQRSSASARLAGARLRRRVRVRMPTPPLHPTRAGPAAVQRQGARPGAGTR
ncbi:hypothetical protein [Streptomyces sp. NPDC048438]|uniref:hypothetical protein n=1 Tax=Streptomyces sp. NPDC048438 TaxID=3365551 RepID=UPI00371F4925